MTAPGPTPPGPIPPLPTPPTGVTGPNKRLTFADIIKLIRYIFQTKSTDINPFNDSNEGLTATVRNILDIIFKK